MHRCIYRIPYARMTSIDLRSVRVVHTLRLTSGQWGMVWYILDHFFFFIVRAEQSRGKQGQAVHLMAGIVVTVKEIADGVLPSWEGVLKLATRAKLHVGHLIYGSWYFAWIPLIERCRIDLTIIRFRHVFMEIWIYLYSWQFVKVGQQAKQCFTPPAYPQRGI